MLSAPRPIGIFVLGAWLVASPVRAQQPGTVPTVTNPPATTPAPEQMRPPEITAMLNDAVQFLTKGQDDAALEQVNLAIRIAPQDPDTYAMRAGIYAQKKLWIRAEEDYQKVLALDPSNVPAKLDLAEIKFQQKLFDPARADFVSLEKDDNLGDLASYRVFLCDLAAGHTVAAGKELDAFNQVGSNASYYYANAAWALAHHKTEEGRGWLDSASRIFAPNKVNSYSISLKDLGYLPLPPSPIPPQ